MVNKKTDLRKVFASISEPMRAVLSNASLAVSHPGTKGDASEYQWVNWLKTYLPKRYCVDSGFIIDFEGTISEQQDIIIYDSQYTPCLLNTSGVLYIPAESVYAVIEVKQELSKKNISYAGKKIASVRNLKRTSKTIKYAGGEYPAKPLHRILGGIVVLKNNWKNPFGKELITALENLSENQRIDIGCSLDQGSFIINYSPKFKLETSSEKDSLIFFFVKTLSKLQDIGTVPAIDFDKYLDTIKG